jgi:hypothetical protein
MDKLPSKQKIEIINNTHYHGHATDMGQACLVSF